MFSVTLLIAVALLEPAGIRDRQRGEGKGGSQGSFRCWDTQSSGLDHPEVHSHSVSNFFPWACHIKLAKIWNYSLLSNFQEKARADELEQISQQKISNLQKEVSIRLLFTDRNGNSASPWGRLVECEDASRRIRLFNLSIVPSQQLRRI